MKAIKALVVRMNSRALATALHGAQSRRSSRRTASSLPPIAGVDFFTAEVWTPRGVLTQYVLFGLDLKTRRVQFAGITRAPGQNRLDSGSVKFLDRTAVAPGDRIDYNQDKHVQSVLLGPADNHGPTRRPS